MITYQPPHRRPDKSQIQPEVGCPPQALQDPRAVWFAGYALPSLEAMQLERGMKFFLCLDYLDVLLEDCVYEEAMEFFYRWEEYLFYQEFDSPFSSLWYALDDVLEQIDGLSDQEWLDTLWIYLDDYLQARRWQLHNIQEGNIPGLNLFVMQNCYGSGVFLAIHFLKLQFPAKEYPIEWIDQKIARIICLSNDLRSFECHRKTQGMENELVIRQIHTGISDAESCRHAAHLLAILMDGFLEMIDELRDGIATGKELAEQLLLLLGGCMYWSEENALRYGTTINGINKS